MQLEHGVRLVNGIRMHHVVAGRGPAAVLLHGWPQTWYMWRLILPELMQRFTVIAPDLRGYGLSDKPAGGYDKRTMAEDVRALVHGLGHRRVVLVGHDRGARVAHRYALDYAGEVERLVVLDILPTREMFRHTDALIARGYWHWFFHLQPDLPELLVGDRVETYLRFFFERWAHNRAAVDEAVPVYLQAFARPGALRAGFADYRATLPDDIATDDADFEAGNKLEMPVLALWGENGLTAKLPVLAVWRKYAKQVVGRPVPDCGHFLPEERPELVTGWMLDFLTRSV